jgi:addiction module RelB/DinJ family antitoxin
MGDITSINLRIDKDLKKQAETLFSDLGMNMTTAIIVFLRQAVRDQAIPFYVSAEKNYEHIRPYKGTAENYSDYDSFVADKLKDADKKAAEGKMRYYTAEEIRSGLEALLSEEG